MSILNAKFKSKFLITVISLIFLGLSAGCKNQTPNFPEGTVSTLTESPVRVTSTSPAQPDGDTISKIQGAAHISPYRNQFAEEVQGTVTVVRSNGFYIQSAQPDDDPATSEGLFIFTEFVPSVRVGDSVSLSGRIVDFIPGGGYGNLSITEMEDPEITVLSSGNPLPIPIILGEGGRTLPSEIIDDDTNGFVSDKVLFDPENDGLDFYESLEGMLVQVNDAVVVGPTNQHKEIVVIGDEGRLASLLTPRGGIVLQAHDFNPERIVLDDLLVELPFVNVGDFASEPIVGVMDYDYGNYRILVTQRPDFEKGGLARSESLEPADQDQLRVATYNVENLSALQKQRINILAGQIVDDMGSPDIIALQEVQDNDGNEGQREISADQTYQGIIDAIVKMGGPRYGFTDVDPIPEVDGGIPFGNIRVGFLYRLDRGLTLVAAPRGDAKTAVQLFDDGKGPKLSHNPGRIDPTHPAFYGSRKSAVAAFDYQGQIIFVVNNHFVSKGEDRPLFGEFQPPLLDSEYQRMNQAQVIHDFVADLLEIDPNSRVIVLGDLNDFQFSAPINLLEGEILKNLVETLPLEEQYCYNFEGNSQMLDQMLASESLSKRLISMDIFHLNSEFNFDQQFSDHDILIATFDWN